MRCAGRWCVAVVRSQMLQCMLEQQAGVRQAGLLAGLGGGSGTDLLLESCLRDFVRIPTVSPRRRDHRCRAASDAASASLPHATFPWGGVLTRGFTRRKEARRVMHDDNFFACTRWWPWRGQVSINPRAREDCVRGAKFLAKLLESLGAEVKVVRCLLGACTGLARRLHGTGTGRQERQ